MKNNKATSKKGEDLTLETVQSSSLFAEPPTSIPPIQSAPYTEGELEETVEDFDLQADEAELVAEEGDEITSRSDSSGRNYFSASGYHMGISKRP